MTVSSLPRPAAPPPRPAAQTDGANDNQQAPPPEGRFIDHRPALRRNAPPPLPLALLCAEIIP